MAPTDAGIAQWEHIAELVRCYLSEHGRRLAAAVGYVTFLYTVYDLGRAKFEAGAGGMVFGGYNAYKRAVVDGLAWQCHGQQRHTEIPEAGLKARR